MLCIFTCPVKVVTDAKGNPITSTTGGAKYQPINDAGICQAAIELQIGPCEHDPTIQYRKEGVYTLQREWQIRPDVDQTLVKLHQAFPDKSFITEQEHNYIVVGETKKSPLDVWLSPSLAGRLTIKTFRQKHDFGNGVTCGVNIRNSKGEIITYSTVVLAPTTAALVKANPTQLEALRALMELAQPTAGT